jgi:hypothetical protein
METALLRQKVELLERIIQGIENERNDLRRRLDGGISRNPRKFRHPDSGSTVLPKKSWLGWPKLQV